MLSNESLHSPAFSRSNSQASIDSTSMEEFLREIESIKENSMGGQEEQIPAEVKPVDGKVQDLLSHVFTVFFCVLSLILFAGRHSNSSLTNEICRICHISSQLSLIYIYWIGSWWLLYMVTWSKEGCQNPNWFLTYLLTDAMPIADLIHHHLADWIF